MKNVLVLALLVMLSGCGKNFEVLEATQPSALGPAPITEGLAWSKAELEAFRDEYYSAERLFPQQPGQKWSLKAVFQVEYMQHFGDANSQAYTHSVQRLGATDALTLELGAATQLSTGEGARWTQPLSFSLACGNYTGNLGTFQGTPTLTIFDHTIKMTQPLPSSCSSLAAASPVNRFLYLMTDDVVMKAKTHLFIVLFNQIFVFQKI